MTGDQGRRNGIGGQHRLSVSHSQRKYAIGLAEKYLTGAARQEAQEFIRTRRAGKDVSAFIDRMLAKYEPEKWQQEQLKSQKRKDLNA